MDRAPGRRYTLSAATLFVLRVPGNTAVLLFAEPHGAAREALKELLGWWRAQYAPGALHYAQCLVEPEATGKRAVLEALSFNAITRLIYLDRSVTYPWSESPQADGLTWCSFAEGGEAVFAPVVQETYDHSLDCPELNGLRPIESVLAIRTRRRARSIRPAGRFAQLDGTPAGCILLAPVARDTADGGRVHGRAARVSRAWRGRPDAAARAGAVS